MGSPGQGQTGAVVIRYAAAATRTPSAEAAEEEVVLKGTELHGRFGWALACLDYNRQLGP